MKVYIVYKYNDSGYSLPLGVFQREREASSYMHQLNEEQPDHYYAEYEVQ